MKKLEQIVSEIIEDRSDLFIVDIMVKGHDHARKVLVLLDGDKGLSIEDCTAIGRKLGDKLEVENLFEGKYTIEVSSPGIDTPLKFPRQYVKNVGRKLKLFYEGKEIKGELLSVKGDSIVLNSEIKNKNKINLNEVEIPLSKIETAKVLVSF